METCQTDFLRKCLFLWQTVDLVAFAALCPWICASHFVLTDIVQYYLCWIALILKPSHDATTQNIHREHTWKIVKVYCTSRRWSLLCHFVKYLRGAAWWLDADLTLHGLVRGEPWPRLWHRQRQTRLDVTGWKLWKLLSRLMTHGRLMADSCLSKSLNSKRNQP